MEDLRARLGETAAHIRELEAQHAAVLAAAEGSNADDEHDPEGATIAFEREQLVAVLAQARRTHAALTAALAAVDDGTYGTCVGCGRPIGAERLEALPATTRCVRCASGRQGPCLL